MDGWMALGLVLGCVLTTRGADERGRCVPSCHMRGRFVNGSCYCDTIYAGPNCERNLLRENTASIVEGLELLYNRTFTMNQKSVIFPHGMAKSGDGIIPLPEGTTHNRTAGVPSPLPTRFLLARVVRYSVEARLQAHGMDSAPSRRTCGVGTAALQLRSHAARWPLGWVCSCIDGTGDFYRVEQKLYQLLPANDSAMGTLRYHTHAQMLGSCAVVGNSGSLLYRQYGRAIDVHDVVYRFNQARRFTSPVPLYRTVWCL
jgi:hypothetical protein